MSRPVHPLSVEPLEDRITPTAGALDRSYGSAAGPGLLGDLARVVNLNPIADLAVGPDGSAYALGKVAQGSGYADDPTTDFGVVKFTPGGQVDRGFGTNGLARVGFDLLGGGRGADLPNAIVVQDDGMIVVGGIAIGPQPTEQDPNRIGTYAAVARLRSDGTLDPQFGTGFSGRAVIAFTNPVPVYDSDTKYKLINRYLDLDKFNSNVIKLAVVPGSHDVVVATYVTGDYIFTALSAISCA